MRIRGFTRADWKILLGLFAFLTAKRRIDDSGAIDSIKIGVHRSGRVTTVLSCEPVLQILLEFQRVPQEIPAPASGHLQESE